VRNFGDEAALTTLKPFAKTTKFMCIVGMNSRPQICDSFPTRVEEEKHLCAARHLCSP
jgi:hypothetical protein